MSSPDPHKSDPLESQPVSAPLKLVTLQLQSVGMLQLLASLLASNYRAAALV